MYLKSISLKNFKRFTDITVAFPSDITVVKGPNEQGKSTVLSAILAGLFYDPQKSNKDILALKSWHADTLYEITMEIAQQGEDIRLYKNFETHELLLENATTQKKYTTFSATKEYLREIGALRDRALFEHTACVRHDALSRVTEGKRDISRALQELLTSSGEGVSAEEVLKKVSALIADIRRGTKQQAKTPGQLRFLENEISDLSSRRAVMTVELKDLAEKSAYRGALSAAYQKIAREHEICKMQYEKNTAYFRIIEEIQKLHTQFDRLHTDRDALKEIEEKKKKISDALAASAHIAALDMSEWYARKEALSVKRETLAHVETEAKQMKERKRESRAHIKPWHLFVSLALFAGGFAGFIDRMLFLLWIPFAVAFIYSFVLKRGLTVHTPKGIAAEAAGVAHEIAVLEKRLERILEENGVKNEEELIAKAKAYNALVQDGEKLKSKEEGILRSRSRREFESEFALHAKRVAIEEAKISEEEKVSPPAPEVQRSLHIDLAHSEKEIARLRREIDQVDIILHSSRVDGEALAIIEEEIEYRVSQKERLTRKVAMLELLAGVLAEAQAKTIETSRKAIESYMHTYLLVLTDGRYDRVRVKDDLSFEVWSEEKKDMIVPEEHLSKGTIDQFYLIARFALLDLLNKGVKSLVLLDDPFAGFDAKRRARAREMLTDMTSAFQIILFTHSAEYEGWGNVIEI